MNREILSIERVGKEWRITARFTWQTGWWIWKRSHESVEVYRGSCTVWDRESDGFGAGASTERWLSAALKRHVWAQEKTRG